jgi:NAD(P)-dependent dehydrogenase (short-subunit alcohol dehydrogenase family)
MNIDKKVILLFGASGGIGKAVKEILEKEADNGLICFTGENLNLLDLENLKVELLKIITGKKIDAVVYTSGLILDSKTETSPEIKNITDIFSVNTYAPILIHNFLQDRLSDIAKFIYLSSTATLGPNGLFPLYTTSKKATETFLKIQADKVNRGENNFKKIICILPGPTNTPMREKIAGDANTKQSPIVIAELISEIVILGKYENGDSLIVKDNTISHLPLCKP